MTNEYTPDDIMETYSASHLVSLSVSNEHAFSLTEAGAERLLQIASEYDAEVFISTQWDNMARENMGESGDTPNYYAIGQPNWEVSAGRGAWLLENAYAVQQEWLDRGDGRLTKAKQIDVTDGDYVDDEGVCWFPKDYTFICLLTDEVKND